MSSRMLLPAALLCLLLPWLLPAQESSRKSADSIQQLSPSTVGPYRGQYAPDLTQAAQAIVEHTNTFRKQQNRPAAVSVNKKLTQAAQYFAEYMARTDKYGHAADGQQPGDRADDYEYDYCLVSENIAYQFRTTGYTADRLAQLFFKGWENSPGHRKNMLHPAVTETGVAVAQSRRTGVYYGVQMFGRPQSASIQFRITNGAAESFAYSMGGEQFQLPPFHSRTHTVCQPPTLTWKSRPAPSKSQTHRITPSNGETYTVQTQSGEITLQRAPTKE